MLAVADPLALTPIYSALKTGGPWGLCAILLVFLVLLYRDIRRQSDRIMEIAAAQAEAAKGMETALDGLKEVIMVMVSRVGR